MSRRSFALGFGSAGLLALGLFAGMNLSSHRTADAGPKAEMKPLRAGYVCVSELMTGYAKWQARTKELNDKRAEAAKRLNAMQGIIAAGGKQVEAATGDDKSRLTNEMFEAKRKFEDAERKYREELDKEAAELLKGLYDDIAAMIRKMADEKQLDVVYGHPAHPLRAMEQHKGNPHVAIELLLRPQAALPLYMRDSVDMTGELVERLNAKADREEK